MAVNSANIASHVCRTMLNPFIGLGYALQPDAPARTEHATVCPRLAMANGTEQTTHTSVASGSGDRSFRLGPSDFDTAMMEQAGPAEDARMLGFELYA